VSGMKRDAPAQAAGVTDLVGRLVDGLGQLLAQHVALARLELSEEAHSLTRALGTLALFTPLLVVGYAMLCFGLAFALARWLSVPGAVLLVGVANLVVGGAGLWTVRKAFRRPMLQDTTAAVRESAHALQAEAHREVSGVH
jgi:uncharacterized membrane protein YqjE